MKFKKVLVQAISYTMLIFLCISLYVGITTLNNVQPVTKMFAGLSGYKHY